MMEKTIRIIFSVMIPLGSLITYWVSIRNVPDNGTHLLWAVLVTIILMVSWYLFFPLRKKIERLSIVWVLGTNFGIALVLIGFISSNLMGYHWGDYIWFFGLWSTIFSFGLPKEYKRHKISFFKSPEPIEDAENAHA